MFEDRTFSAPGPSWWMVRSLSPASLPLSLSCVQIVEAVPEHPPATAGAPSVLTPDSSSRGSAQGSALTSTKIPSAPFVVFRFWDQAAQVGSCLCHHAQSGGWKPEAQASSDNLTMEVLGSTARLGFSTQLFLDMPGMLIPPTRVTQFQKRFPAWGKALIYPCFSSTQSTIVGRMFHSHPNGFIYGYIIAVGTVCLFVFFQTAVVCGVCQWMSNSRNIQMSLCPLDFTDCS